MYLRGFEQYQEDVKVGEATEDPDAINVTALLVSTSPDVLLHSTVESSASMAQTPKCSPVIMWTHNRIECFIHPLRAPKVGVMCLFL